MTRPRARTPRGFTLIEVTVAITLLALTVTFIYGILRNAVRQRDDIRDALEGPKVDAAILDQVLADFRFVYWRQGLLPSDAGFWGRPTSVGSKHVTRVDFLTARRGKIAALEDAQGPSGEPPLVETGYALRTNERYPDWLELWRREDFFVDDEPTDGGKFALVYDKVREFSIRFFNLPEELVNPEGLEEWDTKTTKKLPYALILKIAFDVSEEPTRGEPQHTVVKVILLKGARGLPEDAGMATGMTAGQ